MVSSVRLIITVVFLGSFSVVFAQNTRPGSSKPAAAQKYIPPKLTSMLANRVVDAEPMLAAEAVQLVGLPIRVTDDKKTPYTVISYQAIYKRRGVTEEEVNGETKVKPTMTNASERFKTTPLPPIWVKTLTEQLRAGEELMLFDIVVKDAQGRMLFAPDIKLKIK